MKPTYLGFLLYFPSLLEKVGYLGLRNIGSPANQWLFKGPVLRVPYYFGDLKRDPD